MLDVVLHARGCLGDADALVVLQPTSPLRRAEHVDAAVALLEETGADCVVSVVEVPHRFGRGSCSRSRTGGSRARRRAAPPGPSAALRAQRPRGAGAARRRAGRARPLRRRRPRVRDGRRGLGRRRLAVRPEACRVAPRPLTALTSGRCRQNAARDRVQRLHRRPRDRARAARSSSSPRSGSTTTATSGLAKKLIGAAASAGCDAVKFQKRTVDVVYSAEELARAAREPVRRDERRPQARPRVRRRRTTARSTTTAARSASLVRLAAGTRSRSTSSTSSTRPATRSPRPRLTDDELLRHTAREGQADHPLDRDEHARADRPRRRGPRRATTSS